GVNITTKPIENLSAADVTAWRTMQRESPGLANPFLSPEFAQAVAAVKPEARVAVLTEGREPVGYFPFERGPFGFGRPIGDGVSDCQGVIHCPGVVWSVDELMAG